MRSKGSDSRLAWMAAKLVSSNKETRYASAASCNAMTAEDWKRRSVYGHSQSYLENEDRPTDLEVLGDLTDEPLEGKLPDQQFSRLLVPSDFTECDSSGAEAMGLLDTTSGGLYWKVPQMLSMGEGMGMGTTYGGSGLPGSLGGELFTGSLAW